MIVFTIMIVQNGIAKDVCVLAPEGEVPLLLGADRCHPLRAVVVTCIIIYSSDDAGIPQGNT